MKGEDHHYLAHIRRPSASHCTLEALPQQRRLCGRVALVQEDMLSIECDGALHPVRVTSQEELRSGDIVEVLLDGIGPTAVSVHLLVRPSRIAPRGSRDRTPAPSELRTVLGARSAMIDCTREFFLQRDFVEVPTPSLVPSPGMEPHLAGFSTWYEDHAGHTRQVWLPTSPEFALKRALCEGLDRIFEIRTVFRNRGEMGPLHYPEFTLLEWYRAFADYRVIMSDTEDLLSSIAHRLGAVTHRTFRGIRIRWDAPYCRMSVSEAFSRYAGIDLGEGMEDEDGFRAACAARLSHVPPGEDFCSLFHRVMIERVEPHLGLGAPVILYDYPMAVAALAVRKPGDPRFCERFELYVAGVEMANAFTEVNDPREMAIRIRRARQEQRAMGARPTPVDGEVLRAMRRGMPPSGGIAVGMDRLLMAMLGLDHIAAVLPFCLHDGQSLRQRIGCLA